jgi:hypothetical protein
MTPIRFCICLPTLGNGSALGETHMNPSKRIRHAIAPRDIPPEKAARRLHLTLVQFNPVKDRLFARGSPRPDPDTANYDSVAIERWMDARSGLDTGADLTAEPKPRNAQEVFGARRASLGPR